MTDHPAPGTATAAGQPPRDWTTADAYRPRRPALLRVPASPTARLTLYALRRIAGHGLRDAQAANLMLAAFGLSFQRPLLLLRTTMLELSHAARRRIVLAPCCCGRMTLDEARLLAVLGSAPLDERRAARHLARLAGHTGVAGPLCAASAYGWALMDLGQPLPGRPD